MSLISKGGKFLSPRTDNPQKGKKGIGRTSLIAVVCLLVLALGVGVTARYVRRMENTQNQVSAKAFYFTLDMLGDTQEEVDLIRNFELYGGNEKKLTFYVQNYFDDN